MHFTLIWSSSVLRMLCGVMMVDVCKKENVLRPLSEINITAVGVSANSDIVTVLSRPVVPVTER
jgi:hypothetical protein